MNKLLKVSSVNLLIHYLQNQTSLSHIIYVRIGINGAECQKRAKELLAKYRDWYMRTSHRPIFAFGNKDDEYTHKLFYFSPNAKKFSDMCDTIIAYDDDEGRSTEFKHAFLEGT